MTDYTKQLVEDRDVSFISGRKKAGPNSGPLTTSSTSCAPGVMKSCSAQRIINPEQVFGRNEKLVQEGIKKNALARGVSQSFIDETEGYTGCVALLDTGKEGPSNCIPFRYRLRLRKRNRRCRTAPSRTKKVSEASTPALCTPAVMTPTFLSV